MTIPFDSDTVIRLKREANTGLGLSRTDNALIKVPSERLQRERKYVKENSVHASIRILSPLRQVEITPTPLRSRTFAGWRRIYFRNQSFYANSLAARDETKPM